MEYIKDNYYSTTINYYNDIITFIWKCATNNEQRYAHRICVYKYKPEDSNYAKNATHGWDDSKLASFEEIHWLNCCIEKDGFVTKEEAMKSFVDPTSICTKPDPELEQILIKLLT